MDCFGDSSDDEEGGDAPAIMRDESCGVLAFHPNTEAALLTHVRNSLPHTTSSSASSSLDSLEAKLQRSDHVLHAIDEFCMSRHWMMHVGPEKGEIILQALRDAMNEKMKRSSLLKSDVPFVAVELGTYCGYASVLMGRAMREMKPDAMNCHLYTTEINRQYAEIATGIIQLAGMGDAVSVHEISFDGHDTNVVSVVSDALRSKSNSQINDQAPVIDFLFIDHDKDSYKSDLCKLEASGMICSGTKVVADNVLFASIDDYVNYVQQRQKEGIVKTRTIPCLVEYCGGDNVQLGEDSNLYQDGVEITDYLQDP